MQVFDFDNTIYNGESAVDFSTLLFKKNYKLIIYLPTALKIGIKYKLCNLDKEEFNYSINKLSSLFYDNKDLIKKESVIFWENNKNKLNKNVIKLINKDDVIVTSTFNFIIDPIKNILPTKNIICSDIDLDNRCINSLNFREDKVINFRKLYKEDIDNFYTDSYNDKPLMNISENVFLVRNNKIKKIK